MIDLHSHILPNFDDGAQNDQKALAMIKLAVASGTQGILATPHVIEGALLPTWDRIVSACEQLSQAASVAGLKIEVFPGAEVAITWSILDWLIIPGPYCINGGKYILVELPSAHIPLFIDEFFFALQTRGFFPILAHPERHPELARKPDLLKDWIGRGVLTQLNGSSLVGLMGKNVMKFAEFLVFNSMIHCLGSDAHGTRTRSPELTAASERITSMIGAKKAEQIVIHNPTRILGSEEVMIQPLGDMIPWPAKHGLFTKWFVRN